MNDGVLVEKTDLGATDCTQRVCRKPRPEHGLSTICGTLVGPSDSRIRFTTPESIMSLDRQWNRAFETKRASRLADHFGNWEAFRDSEGLSSYFWASEHFLHRAACRRT